jgi:hypothetical protein
MTRRIAAMRSASDRTRVHKSAAYPRRTRCYGRPTVKRLVLAVAIVSVLLTSCAQANGPGAGVASTLPEGFRRVVRTQWPAKTFVCRNPSNCRVATIGSWKVKRPSGMGSFTLVISLTFSYRLSPGDVAHLGINTWCSLTEGTPAPCPTPSPTRTQPLSSVHGATTTTITWGLPSSDGLGSIVYFQASLDDQNGDGSVQLAAKHLTAVFEMWPSA